MPAVMGRAEISSEEAIKALEHWREEPLEFLYKFFAVPKLEKKQEDVFTEFFKHKRVAVATHHVFGKSLLCGAFALCVPNLYPKKCRGLTTAPTFAQVQDIIWAEMRGIYEQTNAEDRVLPGKITLTRYDLGPNCFVFGISPRKTAESSATPQFIQGFHAGTVFVVIDEAGAVPDQVWEQIEGITNTAGVVHIIAIGNPLNIRGKFARIFRTSEREGWYTIQVKAYEAPNMVANGLTSLDAIRKEADRLKDLPEEERRQWYDNKYYKIVNSALLSPGWVMEKYMTWGESPLFFAKVIGEWVEDATNTLVTLTRAEEIMYGKDREGNWISEKDEYAKYNGSKSIAIGLDCARDGADKNVLFALQGNRQLCPTKKFAKTFMKTDKGERLKEDGKFVADEIVNKYVLPNPSVPIGIAIDMTGGYGASAYDFLSHNPHVKNNPLVFLMPIKFSSKASNEELYPEIVTEMALQLSDDIYSEEGLLLLPDEDLKNQLTSRRKGIDPKTSRDKLESKEDFKKRSGKSPDEFDGLMLANRARRMLAQKLTRRKLAREIVQDTSESNTMSGSLEEADY